MPPSRLQLLQAECVLQAVSFHRHQLTIKDCFQGVVAFSCFSRLECCTCIIKGMELVIAAVM